MELSILNLLLVLISAWTAGTLVTKIGYPSIFGELMVGIVLGPSLLGLLHGSEALDVLAELGVLLMMLYIGLEIDPEELFRASWPGLLAALGGFITPFVFTYLVVVWFGGTVAAGLFVGIAAGVTSLATKSRILVDLKLLDTRIAHVLMAGALVADTLSLLVFAAIIGVFDATGFNIGQLGIVALKAAFFFAVVVFTGIKIFPLLWQRLTRAGLTGRTFNITLILLIALFFAELAEVAGLHAILGAFLAGLFIREGIVLERKLSADLISMVHDVSIGFLAPIFFVTAGFHVSLDVFSTHLPLLLSVIAVATLGKIVGTTLFYLPSGHGWREGVTVGAGMNGRGAVEIIIANIGLQMGIITPEIFSILVFMAIITTAMVPLFLKWGTDWLRGRGELVRSREERKGTIIVGAGPTARLLARELSQSQPVWLIDKNRRNCRAAREEGLNIINGDALDVDVLSQANAAHAQAFLAMTPNMEVNVLAAQQARTIFRIPEVNVPLAVGDDSLRSILSEVGVQPSVTSWGRLDQWDHWISYDEVTQTAVEVTETSDASEMLAELRSQTSRLPLTVAHNGQNFPFPIVNSLNRGDRILLLNHT